MPDLKALLERVEKADGQDPVLDADIATALRPLEDAQHHWLDASPVTSSLDSALALVEEKLPGHMHAVGNMEEGPFCRLVVPMPYGTYVGGPDICGHAETEPLAVLSALLRALISEQFRVETKSDPVEDQDVGEG